MNQSLLTRRRPKLSDTYEWRYKVGEGTYGVVGKAVHRVDQHTLVAVKEFKTTKASEGISHSAVREIALLKELDHENLVALRDVYVDPEGCSMRLVYEYAEYELSSIIKHHKQHNQALSLLTRKSILYQMLNGLHYLHSNWVMHRDLKPSNILVMGDVRNELGVVKIADFGMARIYRSPLRKLLDNGMVVTIWYRAPELLLGAQHYTTAIDIWAVGCILGELITCVPLFQGGIVDDVKVFPEDQVDKIWKALGALRPSRWPDVVHLSWWQKVADRDDPPALNTLFGSKYNAQEPMYDLLLRMLDYNPVQRISARDALQHRLFRDPPAPCRNVFGHGARVPYADRREYRSHPQQHQRGGGGGGGGAAGGR